MQYQQLVERGRAIVADLTRNKWELGDLALEAAPVGRHGVVDGGRDALAAFAEDIGMSATTLRNYRDTASAWPEDRRRSSSFTAHMELRSHPDRFSLLTDTTSKRGAMSLAGRPERPSATVEQVREALSDPTFAAEVVRDEGVRRALDPPVDRQREADLAPSGFSRSPETADASGLALIADIEHRLERLAREITPSSLTVETRAAYTVGLGRIGNKLLLVSDIVNADMDDVVSQILRSAS